ncbi:uncharacterized protein [Henckelia pumila]|uniref:uncharacterized protein isoform X2 n=1 Tax=Henckelia pumila TaxID=405737 RepID=UPI003C6E8E9E
MEDSGEGKPAEPRGTTEEVEEEMGSPPEDEMKTLSENDFCSGGSGSSEIKKQHYCKECDKSFSCGKALGGHMSSAHAQANKGIHGKRRDFKNQHYKSSSTLPLVACRVCGKRFKSNKSLYGHMKNHPDRNWRGVSPPPEIESPQQDPAHALAWPVTAKRGRASSKLPDIEEGVRLAAQQLLQMLKSTNSMHKGLKICERGGGQDHEARISGSEMNVLDGKGKSKIIKPEDYKDSSSSEDDAGINSNLMFDVAVRYPTSEENYGNAGSSMMYEEYSTGSNKKFANGSPEEQSKDQKQPDDGAKVVIISKNNSKMASSKAGGGSSSDSSTRSKYVCSVCGQRFDNPKALGGHRESHNRFKICIHNTINGKPTYVTSNGDVAAKKSEQLEQDGAAGGAEEEEEPAEMKVESKILDFDLNQSPRCDDADE